MKQNNLLFLNKQGALKRPMASLRSPTITRLIIQSKRLVHQETSVTKNKDHQQKKTRDSSPSPKNSPAGLFQHVEVYFEKVILTPTFNQSDSVNQSHYNNICVYIYM